MSWLTSFPRFLLPVHYSRESYVLLVRFLLISLINYLILKSWQGSFPHFLQMYLYGHNCFDLFRITITICESNSLSQLFHLESSCPLAFVSNHSRLRCHRYPHYLRITGHFACEVVDEFSLLINSLVLVAIRNSRDLVRKAEGRLTHLQILLFDWAFLLVSRGLLHIQVYAVVQPIIKINRHLLLFHWTNWSLWTYFGIILNIF